MLICCGFFQSCGGLKLIDVSKTSAALQLTATQQQQIPPKLELIRDIVEDYNFEKKQLEMSYQVLRTGRAQQQHYGQYEGRGTDTRTRRQLDDFREEARKFLTQRDTFLNEIKNLIHEIATQLTPEQQIKMAELKLPKLEVPMMLRRDPYSELRYIPDHPLGRVNLF